MLNSAQLILTDAFAATLFRYALVDQTGASDCKTAIALLSIASKPVKRTTVAPNRVDR